MSKVPKVGGKVQIKGVSHLVVSAPRRNGDNYEMVVNAPDSAASIRVVSEHWRGGCGPWTAQPLTALEAGE